MIRVRDANDQVLDDPRPADVRALVAGLQTENGFLVVERTDSDRFIQTLPIGADVWMIERHAPERGEHYRTEARSGDSVAAALIGWIECRSGWEDAFTWQDVSAEFRAPWWRRLFGRRH